MDKQIVLGNACGVEQKIELKFIVDAQHHPPDETRQIYRERLQHCVRIQIFVILSCAGLVTICRGQENIPFRPVDAREHRPEFFQVGIERENRVFQ